MPAKGNFSVSCKVNDLFVMKHKEGIAKLIRGQVLVDKRLFQILPCDAALFVSQHLNSHLYQKSAYIRYASIHIICGLRNLLKARNEYLGGQNLFQE